MELRPHPRLQTVHPVEDRLEHLHALQVQKDPPQLLGCLRGVGTLQVHAAAGRQEVNRGLQPHRAARLHNRAEAGLRGGEAEHFAAIEVAQALHLLGRGGAGVDLLGQVDARADFLALRLHQVGARLGEKRSQLPFALAQRLLEHIEHRELVRGIARPLGQLPQQPAQIRQRPLAHRRAQLPQQPREELVVRQVRQRLHPSLKGLDVGRAAIARFAQLALGQLLGALLLELEGELLHRVLQLGQRVALYHKLRAHQLPALGRLSPRRFSRSVSLQALQPIRLDAVAQDLGGIEHRGPRLLPSTGSPDRRSLPSLPWGGRWAATGRADAVWGQSRSARGSSTPPPPPGAR